MEDVLGVWESMDRCGVWGVGVWKYVWGVGKCVWGVGRDMERVLGWGQRMWECMGRCGVRGIGVWKCVWGVGKCV